MKAAFIQKAGNPNVIEYGEVATPKIQEHDVLIKVAAVTVNPIDTYIRSGKYTFEEPLPTPFVIGCDAVGVIAEVGSAVRMLKPGDRVWVNHAGLYGRQGSFAQYLAINENLVYLAPKHVDDSTLVAVVYAAATACIGLIRAAMLKANEVIFVNGGAGAVGSAVIQLAVARGARVIAATGDAEKAKWCKSLGAELVLDYHTDDFAKKIKAVAPQGIDVFWDTSKHPNFELSVPLLAHRGRIILMAGYDAHPTLPVGPFYNKECSLRGFTVLSATPLELRGCAEIINRCLEDHKLTAKVAEELPLSEAAAAHVKIESNPDLWGKIVLKP